MPQKHNPSSLSLDSPRLTAALLFIAIALAVFLRFFQLNQIPPGFTFDEASHALDAMDILKGHWLLLSPRLKETSAVYMYLLAAAFQLFGATPPVQRGLTALLGALLIPVNFLTVRRLFAQETGAKAGWLAAFSSLLLATAMWPVLTSRIGYEYILPPIWALLALYCFWRGYPKARWGWLLLTAGFTAANFYTYNAAAPFLLVILTAVVGHHLLNWVWPTRPPQLQVAWKVVGILALAITLLTIPLFWALFSGPNPEAQRSLNQSILADVGQPGQLLKRLNDTLLAHTQTFLGIHGDDYWWAGQPLLDPLLGLCLGLGLLIGLTRLRQLPYLMMLVYWAGMLAAAMLTYSQNVNHFRMSGALPATYFFIALAWVKLADWLRSGLERLFPRLSDRVATGLGLTPFLLAGLLWLPWQTYQAYFITWANEPAVAIAHDVSSVKLVERLAQETDPTAIFLLRRLANNARPNYILDFLYHGQAPLRYLPVEAVTLPQTLTDILAGYQTVHLITRLNGAREGLHQKADPESEVPLLLSQHGQLSQTEDTADYTMLTYRLESPQVVFQPPLAGWQLPPDFNPLDIKAAGLKLAGFKQQLQEKAVQVDLAWQGQGQINQDYIISLQLINSEGQRLAGLDTLPERNFRTLAPKEIMLTRQSLPLPDSLPPGSYTLQVGLYFFSGNQLINIGSVPIGPPLNLSAVSSQ